VVNSYGRFVTDCFVVLIDSVYLAIQSCYPGYLLNAVLIPGKQSRHYHSNPSPWMSGNLDINLFEQISVFVGISTDLPTAADRIACADLAPNSTLVALNVQWSVSSGFQRELSGLRA
jgi:hypothetical protein